MRAELADWKEREARNSLEQAKRAGDIIYVSVFIVCYIARGYVYRDFLYICVGILIFGRTLFLLHIILVLPRSLNFYKQ